MSRSNQRRAEELFQGQLHCLREHSDKLFGYLMLLQYAGAIIWALLASPLTWTGKESAVHPHVLAAIWLGGIIAVPIAWICLRTPGRVINPWIVSVGQMLMSALLIHVSGGRIETHFHVFGSLAFLAFYRDWRILLPATVVIAVDHVARGIYLPASVYGVPNGAEWRFLEHAAWVIFEDTILVAAILRSVQEMRDLAERQASMEQTQNRIERLVQERTKSLQASEDRFRVFAEHSADALFIMGLRGEILYVNDQACESFGYEFHELLSSSAFQIQKTFSSKELMALFEKLDDPVTIDAACVRLDGSVFPGEIRARGIEVQGQKCILASIRDVTERLKAFEDIRKSEERFHFLCQATNDAIWDLNLATGEAWLNDNFFEQYGNLDSVEGWMKSVHPDDMQRVRASFDEALIQEGSLWTCDLRFRKPDGRFAEVLDRGFIIRDADGEPVRVIGALTDMTERKRVESELNAKKEAERASKAKSQFLSRMSHELRTPLNSILGFAQLLQLNETTKLEKECIGHIMSGGKHLLQLINEVLDIAKIESGSMALSTEAVVVSEAVEEAFSMIQPLAAEKGIVLVNEVVTCEELSVVADRQRLLQVLINLLSNAVKFNKSEGRVVVGCEALSLDKVQIWVEDTGIGIPDDVKDRVFTPFDRLGSESGTIEGTGLGLSFSKNLVQVMGGDITFESEEGEGTTFYVELLAATPLKLDLEVLAEAAALLPVELNAMKILYIEDNPSNIVLMRHVIGIRDEWNLSVAETGPRGLEMVEELRPDLILLDLDLPGMGGDEILSILRAQPEYDNVRILVISADATQARIEELVASGAEGYVTKPFDVKELVSKIAETPAQPLPKAA